MNGDSTRNSFYQENFYENKEGIDLVERNLKIAFTKKL